MTKLYIHFNKELVGSLRKSSDDTLHFQYTVQWLKSSTAFPLTPALPLQKEEFSHRLTKSFFDNLLPEGDTLKTIEKLQHKSLQSSFQFLQEYGQDCAGAFTISRQMELSIEENTKEPIEIKKEEFRDIIRERKSLFVYSLQEKGAKFSLAGAQDKIPVIYEEGRIFLPQDSRPTTHILKPPSLIKEAYESVYNEFICLQAAKEIGFSVPEVSVLKLEERYPLFLISRYDRQITNDHVERLHQFDLCQAQGYPANEKYEEDDGPGIEENYKFISKFSSHKIRDLEYFIDWIVFNLLIGNNDGHSKNLSFLKHNDHQYTLAPLYDVLSIAIYDGFDESFAFSVGGLILWYEMHKKDFEKQLQKMGFKPTSPLFKKSMLKLSKNLPQIVSKVIKTTEQHHGELKISRPLFNEVQKRCEHFRVVFL